MDRCLLDFTHSSFFLLMAYFMPSVSHGFLFLYDVTYQRKTSFIHIADLLKKYCITILRVIAIQYIRPNDITKRFNKSCNVSCAINSSFVTWSTLFHSRLIIDIKNGVVVCYICIQ